jgi:hypothetical protein
LFLTGVGFAGLILAHNTLALIFLPVLGIYQIIIDSGVSWRRRLGNLVVSGIWGISLSAFFWVPVLFELQYTRFANVQVSDWSHYTVGREDWWMLGWVSVGILGITMVTYIGKLGYRSRVGLLMVATSIIGGGLAIFPWVFAWDTILNKLVQFPFRFLSLIVIATPFLVSSVLHQLQRGRGVYLTTAGICIAIALGHGILSIQQSERTNHPDGYYSTNEGTTTVQNEYMPIWVESIPTSRATTRFERIDDTTIQLNTIFWPGHAVTVNGTPVELMYDNPGGLIRVPSRSDTDVVEVTFRETPARMGANAITLLGILATVYVLGTRHAVWILKNILGRS